MAYDRYENRGGWRDDDGRDRNPRGERDFRGGGERGGDDRGFFERARDEVQSWFGDEEAERRRMQDDRASHPDSDRFDRDRSSRDQGGFVGGDRPNRERDRSYSGGQQERYGGDDHRGGFFGGGRDHRDHDEDRGRTFRGGQSSSYGRGREGGSDRDQYGRAGESGRGYDRQSRSYLGSYGQSGGGSYSPRETNRDYGYRGDANERSDFRRSRGSGGYDDDRSGGASYRSGLGGQDFAHSQYGRQDFSQDQDRDRGDRGNRGGWEEDDGRRQSSRGSGMGALAGEAAAAGASRLGGGHHDEHYSSWRQRQIDELDRDYDAYRDEHRSKFENDFSGWRQQRQTKRQMLQSIREHDEVVDQNGEHIGTVNKVHGDTVILAKNDPDAGGVHRSFGCSLLERVDGGKVYLGGTRDSIRGQLREEREGANRGGGILGGLFGGRRDDEQRGEISQSGSVQTSRAGSTEHTGEGPHILDRSFSGTYDDGSNRKS